MKTDEPKAEGGGGEEAASSDPNNLYRYVQADLFTSEIFKVEIQNLPKFIGFNDLKKFLEKHRLNPHKIKLFGKQTFAFVTFKNEEERDKAMKMVHGMQWKGRVLSVRLAKPKADPMLRKRGRDEAGGAGQPPSKRQEAEEDEAPLSIQIANVVTPLWNVPYEEQLRRKEQEVEGVLQRLARYSDVYRPMPCVASGSLNKNNRKWGIDRITAVYCIISCIIISCHERHHRNVLMR